MNFVPKDALTEEEVDQGLRWVTKDGLASQAMVTLTGGVFLVGFALKLGAPNYVIGLLAALPPLADLLQLPAILLVERVRNRKLISVFSAALARSFWLLIALIPFLFSAKLGLVALLIAVFVRYAIVSFVSVGWNSWMRDLVPQGKLGTFFSRRMTLTTALALPLSLGAAFYLDKWKLAFPERELEGYSLLFALGFLAGIIGVYFIYRTPEQRMEIKGEKEKFFSLLLEPFRDVNFRNLMAFSSSWSFAVSLAAPFFTVYMLKRLEFGMPFVILLSAISQLMHIVFLRVWGRLADRFNNKSVLAVCGPVFILSILGWTFTTLPEEYSLTVPLLFLLHILMGISMAGVNLTLGNIGFKLAPREGATAYLATRNIMNSIAAGVGPILGGFAADFFAGKELSMLMRWTTPTRDVTFHTLSLQKWDFFFVLAFIIGLYSIHRLALVKEEGSVKKGILVQELFSELKRDMHSFSTIGGTRYINQLLPWHSMRNFVVNLKAVNDRRSNFDRESS